MGHSFGGAFVQLLLDAGFGAAGVSIDGAAVKGVQALPFSEIKSTFPVLKNPANRRRWQRPRPAARAAAQRSRPGLTRTSLEIRVDRRDGRVSMVAMRTAGAAWVAAVRELGGDAAVAEAGAAELTARYAESHRRYHDTAHVAAVLRDAALLAEDLGLPHRERAVLALAAAAHDVVYDGEPGEDERRSAAWARDWLTRATVPETDVARVEALVLATLAHTAPADDHTALALLDADLAILGAPADDYARYRATVRAEYARHDDATFRAGRAAVLTDLIGRDPLYATEVARQRWAAAAKVNLANELAELRG